MRHRQQHHDPAGNAKINNLLRLNTYQGKSARMPAAIHRLPNHVEIVDVTDPTTCLLWPTWWSARRAQHEQLHRRQPRHRARSWRTSTKTNWRKIDPTTNAVQTTIPSAAPTSGVRRHGQPIYVGNATDKT
jgi:hypothetical protein